jgi:hypothetical protein
VLTLFLKHKILEYSINNLFKTIESNFKTLPDIYVNSKFKSITIAIGLLNNIPAYTTYNDCTITSVYSGIYLNKPETIFNFTDSSGELIMGCTSSDIKFNK